MPSFTTVLLIWSDKAYNVTVPSIGTKEYIMFYILFPIDKNCSSSLSRWKEQFSVLCQAQTSPTLSWRHTKKRTETYCHQQWDTVQIRPINTPRSWQLPSTSSSLSDALGSNKAFLGSLGQTGLFLQASLGSIPWGGCFRAQGTTRLLSDVWKSFLAGQEALAVILELWPLTCDKSSSQSSYEEKDLRLLQIYL